MSRILAYLLAGNILLIFSGPASASIIINEIMRNPVDVGDADGEWFELYNSGTSGVDLTGWTIADLDTDSHIIAGSLEIGAGEYLVLGKNADPSTNGGVNLDYAYGTSMILANTLDELVLYNDLGMEIDRVVFDGTQFPHTAGASMALLDPALDNNDSANWVTSTDVYSITDRGTPGAANFARRVQVPEPASVVLMLLGLSGIVRYRSAAKRL